MTAKGSTLSTQLLMLIYNGIAFPGIALPDMFTENIYIAFHTANPTAAGSQSTSEISYPGYVRGAIPRTLIDWIVTGNSVAPAADLVFPESTILAGTIRFFSTGTDPIGATPILHYGPVDNEILVQAGVAPVLRQNTVITET